MADELITPYGDIIRKLVSSIMRAQSSIVDALSKGVLLEDINPSEINRHFSWLALTAKSGINRHLFDGSPDGTTLPLMNSALRYVRAYPPRLRTIFETTGSIPADDESLLSRFVRDGPTRISRLIINEFSGWDVVGSYRGPDGKKYEFATIASPLLICTKYLTVPDSPGSSAYAFLAVRNFLIESLNRTSKPQFDSFNEGGLIDTIEFIKTSFRDRYFSRGKDKLPVGRGDTFSFFVREFLALTGLYNFRFSSIQSCVEYLSAAEFDVGGRRLEKRGLYEYDRRPHLNQLPEVGDLANQIWGLPLPIRGADVVFRGGLKFPGRKGLVMAIHGGPGTGKTSLALGVGASLAGFGVKTLFFSAEETPDDLHSRAATLVPAAYRRLSFYPKRTREWLEVLSYPLHPDSEGSETALKRLIGYFDAIRLRLEETASTVDGEQTGVKSPCRLVVVLDGLHDLISRSDPDFSPQVGVLPHPVRLTDAFHEFVERCKKLKALVVLTVGDNWKFGAQLDYLVDATMHLTHDTGPQAGGKPERLVNLTKARHQSCSAGTHGFQISGEKGVRLTPQTNFCLDLESIWTIRLSDDAYEKRVLKRVAKEGRWNTQEPQASDFESVAGIRIFKSSNIFLNGEGSGGKAGMALKIAAAPYYAKASGSMISKGEKILIISFLYPEEYYKNVHEKIRKLKKLENIDFNLGDHHSRIEVIQFYPGFLKPSSLFSKIEWFIEQHDLLGDPFTTVILDGLHNVFIQFPELERHQIIWPQLYSMLRKKDVTIITTHTVLMVSATDGNGDGRRLNIDDYRSDPLRHALVQKTDFSFEVDPVHSSDEVGAPPIEYEVKTLSAIGQPLSRQVDRLCWHRENLFFYKGCAIPRGQDNSPPNGR